MSSKSWLRIVVSIFDIRWVGEPWSSRRSLLGRIIEPVTRVYVIFLCRVRCFMHVDTGGKLPTFPS